MKPACFFAMCKNAQNSRKTVVFTLSVSNLQHEGQNRGFGKKAKNISRAAPIIIFVFFGVAPCFRKKGVSKIDEISLKPLKT